MLGEKLMMSKQMLELFERKSMESTRTDDGQSLVNTIERYLLCVNDDLTRCQNSLFHFFRTFFSIKNPFFKIELSEQATSCK